MVSECPADKVTVKKISSHSPWQRLIFRTISLQIQQPYFRPLGPFARTLLRPSRERWEEGVAGQCPNQSPCWTRELYSRLSFTLKHKMTQSFSYQCGQVCTATDPIKKLSRPCAQPLGKAQGLETTKDYRNLLEDAWRAFELLITFSNLWGTMKRQAFNIKYGSTVWP